MSSYPGRNVDGTFESGRPVKKYRMRYDDGRLKLVHRLRAEKALGRELPDGAVVHHADGSKDDSAPLVICENEKYHRLLHARMRIVRAGGDPNRQRICVYCRAIKDLDAFIPSAAAKGKWICCGCPTARLRRRKVTA